MVAYFIFWVIQFPFLCLHPNKLRWLFAVKSIIVPIAFIAILVWAFVAEKGGGAIFDNQSASVSGSKYSWLFLANMTSVLGNYATLSVNQVSFILSDGMYGMYTTSRPIYSTYNGTMDTNERC